MKKSEVLRDILKRLHEGATVEEVKGDFADAFQDVPASEIAAAEKELILGGVPVEEIQNLCDVHATLFSGSVQTAGDEPETGHPLMIFSEENKGILAFLDGRFRQAVQAFEERGEEARASLVAAVDALRKIDLHYKRKETLLFPYLERDGVTAPPKVMWGVDDEIRGFIKELRTAAESGTAEEVKAAVQAAEEPIRSMVKKEEEILKPLLIHHLTEEDWQLVAQESAHIGYCFTGDREGAAPSDAQAWIKKGTAAPEPKNDAPIQLPSGSFEVHELEALLNSLPVDLTFVGADDTVRYFSETKERIFPRTRTILGRNVSDCHPPKSLHAVEELVADFKSGKKDNESFWIQQGEAFILIRYFAVRSAEGEYLGVVETTENIAPLRVLEGQKTLLS